ncbi:MAG: SufE family protein [Chlamydiales bacterium]|nr:SufE family protein [Chlamydiales bacterium]
MFDECEKKQADLKQLFNSLKDREAKYNKIIELGRSLKPMAESAKTDENLVKGCQSRMFLTAHAENDKIYFEANADALISAGLAALLLHIYNEQPIETILKCKPTALQEIGIPGLLSPSRSNGLASLFKRMQLEALKFL